MTRTLRYARILAVLVVAIAASMVLSGSAGADRSPSGRSTVTVAAIAIPVVAGTTASDDVRRYQHSEARATKANAAAVASVNCGRCRGDAVAIEVVYAARGSSIVADNVATASSISCTGCTGSALSVQVAIVRSARSVVAANRAIALTVACVHCRLAAAAIQLVVVAPSGRQLSPTAMARIEALLGQLKITLPAAGASRTVRPGPPAPQASQATREPAPVTAAVTRIQAAISSDLGALSATHDVKVTTS
jgi:hypothetical protein